MALARSPLAPETFPDLPPIAGVRVAGQAVGLKKTGARDLFLAVVDPGATVAGVFTRSLCASAPVEDRKSTRLNSSTNAHLVCRLLLDKNKNSRSAHKPLAYNHDHTHIQTMRKITT